ncbi:Protein of unknown function [Micromonospora lupini str. Lupac 08]|uniref:Uncharacterized protein n=1 Tax=Micromonospora lupini str. Lupac 08 TaxID=1150864 RepID=I0L4I8_9ACTN|nr:Protein of unknown function [Micromonospora lupini str. Lupac 08]
MADEVGLVEVAAGDGGADGVDGGGVLLWCPALGPRTEPPGCRRAGGGASGGAVVVDDDGEVGQGGGGFGRGGGGAGEVCSGGGGEVEGGAAGSGGVVVAGGGAGEVAQVQAVGGEELFGECGGVAAVGAVPVQAGAFGECVATGCGCRRHIDQHLWERFHAVWSDLPHPFSGFPVRQAATCSMLDTFAWYCASLVM